MPTDAISLDDVKQALESEPDELSNLTEEERKVAAKILPIVAGKANATAEARKAKDLEKLQLELTAQNKKLITEYLEDLKKQNTPPTIDELEKLVNQEYIEFTVKIRERSGQGGEKIFTIRELPQAVELKLFKSVQRAIVPHLKQLSQLEFSGEGMADKLQVVIDAVPELIDTLAENAALCLDPYNAGGITKEWVQANLSSYRVMSIIEAQVTAGRFRDFFSAASRSIPSMNRI